MNASIQSIRKKNKINAHSIFKYNQPKTEIPTSTHKLSLKSWLFIIPSNFGSHYQQWFKQMYILKTGLIIWQSPSWFMKCMAANIWYWR